MYFFFKQEKCKKRKEKEKKENSYLFKEFLNKFLALSMIRNIYILVFKSRD